MTTSSRFNQTTRVLNNRNIREVRLPNLLNQAQSPGSTSYYSGEPIQRTRPIPSTNFPAITLTNENNQPIGFVGDANLSITFFS